jgi:hypothetical protein
MTNERNLPAQTNDQKKRKHENYNPELLRRMFSSAYQTRKTADLITLAQIEQALTYCAQLMDRNTPGNADKFEAIKHLRLARFYIGESFRVGVQKHRKNT